MTWFLQIITVLTPFAPFQAEESWKALGYESFVSRASVADAVIGSFSGKQRRSEMTH